MTTGKMWAIKAEAYPAHLHTSYKLQVTTRILAMSFVI